MFYGIIAICGILSFLSIWSPMYPLKWATSFSWFGMLVYWIQADLVVDGTPTDVLFMLLWLMLGLLFLMWGMAGRTKQYDVEVSMDKRGNVIGEVWRGIGKHPSSNNRTEETPEEYRAKVRAKLNRGKKK